MNQKGQAVIEFVLILPVFVLLVLGAIEFGSIIYQKYQLENHLDYVVDLYREQKEEKINQYARKHGVDISMKTDDVYTVISIEKSIKISAPVVSNILGKKYKIKTSRTILYEES